VESGPPSVKPRRAQSPVPAHVDPPRAVAEPPARRRPSALWILAALLVAGAGVALPFVVPTAAARDARPQLQADADRIAGTIDTATAAGKSRAKTLATTPLLRAGIDTDAATLQDLAKNESLFLPVAGEVIEVFQLRDGAPVSMLRLPASSSAIRPALDETTRLASDGRALAVVASARIGSQGGGTGGVLAVATPCDLAPVAHGLADHAAQATLTGVDPPIAIVPSHGASGRTITVPVGKGSPLALAAVVADSSSAEWLSPARFALWALAAVFALVYVLRRR
jgi:hypothetical protein